MGNITIIGLDLAKNSFQVHGADKHGKAVLRKKLNSAKAAEFFAQLPPCIVAMEACCGAHFWGARIRELGHDARLINPKYVKPFVKRNKNDAADAEAICEAASRPNMRFVPIKNPEQLELQALHRIRERLVTNRTALVNQARGLLTDAGIVVAKGISHIRHFLLELTSDPESDVRPGLRDILSDLVLELTELDEKIKSITNKIKRIAADSPVCSRLMSIPGVGALTASAMVAAVGDAKNFKNGREFAAWLGLTPRESSTGGKQRLLGISKRGDSYVRKLLIHGARAVLRHLGDKQDRISRWLRELEARGNKNKAAVALANKTARICWVVLTREEVYRAAA